MDFRYNNLGFVGKHSSNAFHNLGKSVQVGGFESNFCADTTLRLDFPGTRMPYMSAPKGIKRKWSDVDAAMAPEVGSSLCLGLGGSSSSSDSKGSSATACTTMSSAKETEEESMELELEFSLHLGSDKSPSPKRSSSLNLKAGVKYPKVDLELSLSTGPTESGVTFVHPNSMLLETGMDMQQRVDEESASSRLRADISLFPLNTSVNIFPNTSVNIFPNFLQNHVPSRTLISDTPELSSSTITTPRSPATCTSGITHQRNSSSKTCQIEGCGKGARGASGRCIAHGGGRRCQKAGCHKGAEGRTVYCKAHGGGRRCEFLGCTKSAEGRTDYCIAHGGGRRCSHEGCTRAARGKSGLCIRHGGGKRCQKENCTKSAEGLSGLCISHGGGRRCQFLSCTKGAQGSTMFCKAHGGGKRCTYEGCTKGAEGSTPFCKGHGGGKRCSFQGGGVCSKCVHGGTLFCVAHGGGKRCAVADCTRSARGRTDHCVRHGGGKRCRFEGCGKSAQGSTDFCKAHGGGKRCAWGHPGSEFGHEDAPCNSFARGKAGLCVSHSALVQDRRVHGGATLGSMVQDPIPSTPFTPKEAILSEVMNVDSVQLRSGGKASPGWLEILHQQHGPSEVHPPVAAPNVLTEGRVHGGSVMAMLAGSSHFGSGSG